MKYQWCIYIICVIFLIVFICYSQNVYVDIRNFVSSTFLWCHYHLAQADRYHQWNLGCKISRFINILFHYWLSLKTLLTYNHWHHPNMEHSYASFRCSSGIILGMGSTNERWRYNVTSSLIGRAHTQNDQCSLLGWRWKCFQVPSSTYNWTLILTPYSLCHCVILILYSAFV